MVCSGLLSPIPSICRLCAQCLAEMEAFSPSPAGSGRRKGEGIAERSKAKGRPQSQHLQAQHHGQRFQRNHDGRASTAPGSLHHPVAAPGEMVRLLL